MKSSWSNWSEQAKVFAVIRISCLAWLCAKAISYKVWLPYRLFPVLPVFDSLPDLPDYFHLVSFALSIAAILAVLVFPTKKGLVLALIVIEIISCSMDMMRWQPWEYQYLLTFVLFYFCKKKNDFIKLFTALLAFTYIFSGIHKFSNSFLIDFWDGLLKHLFGIAPNIIAMDAVHYSGLIMGLIEVVIGVGLLFFKKKKAIIYLCFTMHLGILLILGPIGLDFNEVVWPWNIAMPLMVWALMYRNPISIPIGFFKTTFNRIALFVLIVLPTLNFFDCWDDYLSFKLYSGGTQKVFVCFDDHQVRRELQAYKFAPYCGSNSTTVSVNKWAFYELGVPLYPEERAYQKFKRQWQKKAPQPSNRYIIFDHPYSQNDVRAIE